MSQDNTGNASNCSLLRILQGLAKSVSLSRDLIHSHCRDAVGCARVAYEDLANEHVEVSRGVQEPKPESTYPAQYAGTRRWSWISACHIALRGPGLLIQDVVDMLQTSGI